MDSRVDLINTLYLYMRRGLRVRRKGPYKIRTQFVSLPRVQWFFFVFVFFPPSGEVYQSRSEEYVKENIIQMGVVAHACNPNIQKVTSRVQGHCQANGEFKGSGRS